VLLALEMLLIGSYVVYSAFIYLTCIFWQWQHLRTCKNL